MKVKYTTIVKCADGREYNLGKGEFPPQPPNSKLGRVIKNPKHRVINAFTRQYG